MRAIRKSLPSPAMIVACAALVIALGDVSYAAAVLPESSVGTVQLKKKAVTASKLRANSVNGLKVKDGSLAATDFKAGQLPAGPQGPKGEPGAQGPKGDSGISGVTVRASNYSSIPANSLKGADAMCQAGEVAVGGGADSLTGVLMESSFQQGGYEAPTGWHVNLRNTNPTPATFLVLVVCAHVG